MNKNLGAVILAAGKGSRMKSTDRNKVVMPLADKPMILHAILLLEKLHFSSIVVVVGFAKESVMKALEGSSVLFAEQKELLGTANAVECALEKISDDVSDVLVIQGDDSFLYREAIINSLIKHHFDTGSKMTLLTIEKENPTGLGRIVRNEEGDITSIVEEKDATEAERQIKEINPACYVFNVDFLRTYLPKIDKSPVSGEYYLTTLVDLAIKNNEKIEALNGGNLAWRGVNTKEELEEAEKIFGELDNEIITFDNGGK